MLSNWVLEKLEVVKDEATILLRDPLRLLPEANGAIHRFASDHGFTAIVASTNLVFRELYEKASASEETKKMLVVDRAPLRRRIQSIASKAPPPFYPDFLARTPDTARIEIDLRKFLVEKTGDPRWPQDTNNPRFARLIVGRLDNVIRAHRNLRVAHPDRFSDNDFKIIIAFSALDIPERAFKTFEPKDYWKVGLLGYRSLEQLHSVAPEVANSIRDELRKAPRPFCWFADHPAETVVRAFYLSTILAQHFDHWRLLIANIDPELKPYKDIEEDLLHKVAPELISTDPKRAFSDLLDLENSLSKEALQMLLLEELRINQDNKFAKVIEREHYSVLIRSLALLSALDDLLTNKSDNDIHKSIIKMIEPSQDNQKAFFIEERKTIEWPNLKEAYQLTWNIKCIFDELKKLMASLNVKRLTEISYEWYRTTWIEKRLSRLEYYLSALERLIHNAELIPRPSHGLPDVFVNMKNRIQLNATMLAAEVQGLLDELNSCFQLTIHSQYNTLAREETDVLLTSHFLKRCVKPNWDSVKENAVVLVFDGMRYDVWEELLKPVLENYLDLIKEYPAASLLPSETHVSRKAISAGAFPDSFDMRSGENKLLKEGLSRELGYSVEVEAINPEGMGAGETVRYRAGNLDFYIFELCDTELHKIKVKTLPDGRQVPSRSLSFIYQQLIKNIIDNEVVAVIKNLPAKTKVFIVADHGFGRVGRERIGLEKAWLNEPIDCLYQNAWLKNTLAEAGAHPIVRQNTLEFTVADLHMPASEEVRKKDVQFVKKYRSVIFPKTGYALSRPGVPFRPDAYSHGGISIQEMLVPMVVMQVRSNQDSIIVLGDISGPVQAIEGEEVEFTLPVKLAEAFQDRDIHIEAQGIYLRNQDASALLKQHLYITGGKAQVVYRFVPDPHDATDEERRKGIMERTLKVSVSYRDGHRTIRKNREKVFSVHLNPDKVVRRVPSHLGKILGLTPRSMR